MLISIGFVKFLSAEEPGAHTFWILRPEASINGYAHTAFCSVRAKPQGIKLYVPRVKLYTYTLHDTIALSEPADAILIAPLVPQIATPHVSPSSFRHSVMIGYPPPPDKKTTTCASVSATTPTIFARLLFNKL